MKSYSKKEGGTIIFIYFWVPFICKIVPKEDKINSQQQRKRGQPDKQEICKSQQIWTLTEIQKESCKSQQI
jgi:hypothetical protein